MRNRLQSIDLTFELAPQSLSHSATATTPTPTPQKLTEHFGASLHLWKDDLYLWALTNKLLCESLPGLLFHFSLICLLVPPFPFTDKRLAEFIILSFLCGGKKKVQMPGIKSRISCICSRHSITLNYIPNFIISPFSFQSLIASTLKIFIASQALFFLKSPWVISLRSMA